MNLGKLVFAQVTQHLPLTTFRRCVARYGGEHKVKTFSCLCCTKVIMSGVNGNVIMSGCGDDNPDDERREAGRDFTKSVSRRADSSRGSVGTGSQRSALLPDQGSVIEQGANGVVHGNRGRPCKRKIKEKTVKRIVELARGKYQGFNDRHLTEKLNEEEQIECREKDPPDPSL